MEKIAKTNNQIRTPDDAYVLKAQTLKADVQIELVKKMGEKWVNGGCATRVENEAA